MSASVLGNVNSATIRALPRFDAHSANGLKATFLTTGLLTSADGRYTGTISACVHGYAWNDIDTDGVVD